MTQEDLPSAEDAREAEKNMEATEDVAEPKVSPTIKKTVPKFKGNSTDLEGYTFDCSYYKQAEKYVSMIKSIAEYVAAE